MAVTYGWSTESIVSEVRKITGRPDESMLSSEEIMTYVNRYYQYVLPKELKIFSGYTFFSFYAQSNVSIYKAPQNFQSTNPVAYCDGAPLDFYTDPDLFYQDYPNQPAPKIAVGTGDGVTNSFTFTVTAPIKQATLYVSDGTQIAKSIPSGRFVDPAINAFSDPYYTSNPNPVSPPPPNPAQLNGSVNFVTGSVINMSFTLPPAAGTTLTATFENYQAAKPKGILFYAQYDLVNSTQPAITARGFFELGPVPDQVYQIKLEGIDVPAPLVLIGTSPGNHTLPTYPFRPDLGPLIALGASLNIFRNFNQMDQYDLMMPEFQRYTNVAMSDTHELYLYQRSVSKF